MIKRLICLASIIVDLAVEVPALPERGGDVLGLERGMAAGGAFNLISAGARLGLPAVYAGPHGTGPFGDRVRAALAAIGVVFTQEPNSSLDTGWTLTLIEPDGERTFVTVTGADGVADVAKLSQTAYLPGDAVYVSGYDLVYPKAGAVHADHVAALTTGLLVALDPGPLAAEIPRQRLEPVLRRTDLLSLNERELALLGGLGPLRELLPASAVLVVRSGAAGAAIHAPGAAPILVPSPSVRVVDSTGAGDVHLGAMLAGLARGLDWTGAVLLANRAAAYAVAHAGPAAGPTQQQLNEFARRHW